MIGKYFEDGNGIILIESIKNENIYIYVDCEITEDGDVIEGTHRGYITPQELKHYTEM